jgi:Glycosyltransferases involved in cell wall biogenesis
MEGKPLISVVIPTFNRRCTVERAIISALGQSYQSIEVVVVDDGSLDGTEEVLSRFKSDARFKYLYQQNRGQSAARNKGIAASAGELIAFLDSDNYWDVDKLASQLEYWDLNRGYDILYSEVTHLYDNGETLPGDSRKRHSGMILKKLLLSNFITNNTVLVPRRCFDELGAFDESLRIAEDYDLWLRFSTRYTFLYHPEKVAYYSSFGARLSADEELNIEVNLQILSRFLERHADIVPPRFHKRALGRLLTRQTESRWNRGSRPSLRQILRALAFSPENPSAWRHLLKFMLR